MSHPAGAAVLDLGDTTLMPGLIDAHVHLFLHPGAEDLQTVEESVPKRTILAELAARDDLMAGYTAERDMGTEGAGSADSAVRDAIDKKLIPGPRMRCLLYTSSVLQGMLAGVSRRIVESGASAARVAELGKELIYAACAYVEDCRVRAFDADIPA